MRIYPEEQYPDLGVVDDDNTEDLRPNSRTAPETQVFEHLAGTDPTNPQSRK
jgi:hypothetical protein